MIAVAMDQQDAVTGEIARNIDQAAQGTRQVAENIADVNHGAAKTGSASTQVLASAKSLSRDSDHLKSRGREIPAVHQGGLIAEAANFEGLGTGRRAGWLSVASRSARTAALFECVSGLGERCPIETTRFDRIKHGAGELSALRRSNWLRSGFRSSDWPAGLNHRRRRLLIFCALEVAIIKHADQRQNALPAGTDAAALFCQSRTRPSTDNPRKAPHERSKESVSSASGAPARASVLVEPDIHRDDPQSPDDKGEPCKRSNDPQIGRQRHVVTGKDAAKIGVMRTASSTARATTTR